MRKINSSASGKLMLFGEYAVLHNRPCLVATIDKSLTLKVVEGKRDKVNESVFVKTVIDNFSQQFGEIKATVKTVSSFGSEHGLGSSAAVTVALTKALFKLKEIKITNKELFDFCYQVVKEVQGVGSGFDLAAAIYGGVVYFVTGGKKIEKLAVKELPLVVGYSGVKADTATMIKRARISQSFLQKSEIIVEQARVALEKQDWETAGKLMNQNQEILRKIGVSTPKLEQLIQASLATGAWGAKLSGAGGGDCMIALANEGKKAAVEKAIQLVGGEIIRVKLAL